jgi:phosphatidylserine/phosphatidylglycerophosphate/cardiolipin synthase-like enzyme
MKFKVIVFSLLLSCLVTLNAKASLGQWFSSDSGVSAPTQVPARGSIEVAFSPNRGATNMIIKAINEATSSIEVAAYSFTSAPIAKALLQAKRRGVNVQIILDKSQASHGYSASKYFANNGFATRIDIKHAIFHDKVIIIDDKTVITGSFNFTKAAETKNAENVLILRDNPELAKLYLKDWKYNWQQAIPQNEYVATKAQRAKETNDE